MTKRELVVYTARLQLGRREDPTNRTPYGVWYGDDGGVLFDGEPWCGKFVSWCCHVAGIPLPEGIQVSGFRGFASCSIALSWYQARGHVIPTASIIPEEADLAFFLDAHGRAVHVGIISEVTTNGIRVVEGNKGDRVQECRYTWKDSDRHFAIAKGGVEVRIVCVNPWQRVRVQDGDK